MSARKGKIDATRPVEGNTHTHTHDRITAAQLAWKETSSWKVKAVALKENELDSYTQQRIWLFLCKRGREDKAAGSMDNKKRNDEEIYKHHAWKMNTSFLVS